MPNQITNQQPANSMPVPVGDGDEFTQLRAYAGDVLYTEGMQCTHMYVIKEGEVDLYMLREEKRVVVETLGPGQTFGLSPQLINGRRLNNAAARTYCELYLVPNETLEKEFGALSRLTHGMLRSYTDRLATAHELIATRVNYQPDILVYAQLLQLVGMAEVGRQKSDVRAGASAAVIASPLLSDIFGYARAMLGHSDVHIRNSIGKLMMLHLIRVSDETGHGKRALFAPRDIVSQARKITSANPDEGKLDYEYISVDEFAAMVDVDRSLLLRKLAGGEFAQDLFTFRKSEILRLLNDKGKKFFADRKLKSPEEFSDINDLQFADQKSVFDAVSRCDAYDLAKVLATVEEEAAKEKILASLSRSKSEDVEREMQSLGKVDPIEVQHIARGIVAAVKERMIQR